MVLALLAGIGAGFVYCLPVNSVNVAIVRRGLAAGFQAALLVSLGAIVGDLVWLACAVLGAELILARLAWRAAIGLAGVLVLWWLAWDAFRSSRRAANVIGSRWSSVFRRWCSRASAPCSRGRRPASCADRRRAVLWAP